jgi:gliding motility-associated-like protein
MPLVYYTPNTFTPDADEFNNEFKPVFSQNKNVGSYHFLIYNRWGELIFESYDLKYGWDGTYHLQMSQDDTYTWELIYADIVCGTGKKHIYGHVNLIK